MNTVVVVGAGQLGSRHLQSLCRLKDVSVEVVDPYPQSIERARVRWLEAGGQVDPARVRFTAKLDEGGPVDLAIVATSADVRADVTRGLLNTREVRALILEKVLFQRIDEYESVGRLLSSRGTLTWVNCPRRLQPLYRAARHEIGDDRIQRMVVTGGEWGLLCNAVHFLDLAEYLGMGLPTRLDVGRLDPEPFASKRPGFLEASGALLVEMSLGGWVSLESVRGVAGGLGVTLEGHHGGKWHLDEVTGDLTTWGADGRERTERFGRMMLQSELTSQVTEAVLSRAACDLVPYDISSAIHRPYLRGLAGYFGLAPADDVAVPIT